MARRDRPARARADRSARTCAHRPLSRRGRRLQRRRRADRLPRFARARARVPAPAGSARRLRARAELSVAAPRAAARLGACGLIVINPPWTLAGELEILLPELAVALSGAGEGASCVDWLAGEK